MVVCDVDDARVDPKDLTGGEVRGNGLFDELMRAIKDHLKEEYEAKRITGAEYANVYLGTLTNAMQTAASFLLSAEKTNQEVLLLKEQVLAAKQNLDLIKAQIRNMDADTALKGKQLDLVDQQIATAAKQVELITAQITGINKDNEVKDSQIQLQGKQALQVEEQTKMVTAQTLNETKQGIVLTNQANKLLSEKALLEQKTKTEQAQILDTVSGSPVTGAIGRKNDLYEQQIKGFKRDAEMKVAKMMADAWSVMRTTDENFTVPSSLAESSMNDAISNAALGAKNNT